MIAAVIRHFRRGPNPVLVKELRQAVRSRLLVGTMTLFLLGSLAISAWPMIRRGGGVRPADNLGRPTFALLYVCFTLVVSIGVSLLVGLRAAGERDGENLDLMYVTTLRPWAVVWGKFAAGMWLVVMMLSMVAPFLTMTYLMRGIDVATIFAALAQALVGIAGWVAFALLVGLLPVRLGAKIVIVLIYLGWWFFRYGFFLGFGGMTWRIGSLTHVAMPGLGYLLVSLGVSLALWTAPVLALAVAAVTPPASNRALVPRVTVTIVWLLAFVANLLYVLIGRGYGARGDMEDWLMLTVLLFIPAMLISISEREDLGRRIRTGIPNGGLPRLFRFLFTSGSAGGVLWCLLMMGITCLVTAHADGVRSLMGREAVPFIGSLSALGALYVACIALSARLLREHTPLRFIRRGYTWALAVGMAFAGTVVPLIAEVFSEYNSRDLWWLNVFSPNFQRTMPPAVVLMIWGTWLLIALLIWARDAARSWRQFRRISPSLMALEALAAGKG